MKLNAVLRSRATLIQALAIAAALVVFGVGLAFNGRFYHEDAYITLRYAWNFLDGQGIVWNAGERVEGYTNFLHLIFSSGLGALGVDLKLASRIIGGASLALALGAIHVAGGRQGLKGSPWRALPLVLVIGSQSVRLNAFGGLETMLYGGLLMVGICLTMALAEAPSARLAAWAGLAFAALAMTRIEGAMFFGISWLYVWLRSQRLRPGAPVLAMALVFGAIFGAYFLWRWTYYSSFLPNTFYVKTGGLTLERIANGSYYVMHYAISAPFSFPATVVALVLAYRRRAITPAMAYLAVLVGVYLFYVAYVGGDYIVGFRFIAPVIPAASLLLALALNAAFPAPGRAVAPAYAAASLALCLQALGPAVVLPRFDRVSVLGEMIGKYIDQQWDREAVIALNAAGAVAYYAPEHRFIDMLGLSDVHIGRREIGERRMPVQIMPGHSKGDGAYVLGRQPDYIILGTVEGAAANSPLFLSDLEIVETPSFLSLYRKREVTFDISGIPNYRFLQENESPTLLFVYYERIR
ncbi:MAG TPA: hypothetical protein VGE07_16410 [Herpetosiphonaceae bacterium]